MNVTRNEYRINGNSTIAVTVEGQQVEKIVAQFEGYYINGQQNHNNVSMTVVDEDLYAANMAAVDADFASFKTKFYAVITAIKTL